jgi:type III secretory pathway component EscU
LRKSGVAPRSILVTKTTAFVAALSLLPHLAFVVATHQQKSLQTLLRQSALIGSDYCANLALRELAWLLSSLAWFMGVVVLASMLLHFAQSGGITFLPLRLRPAPDLLVRVATGRLLGGRTWHSITVRVALLPLAWLIPLWIVFRNATTVLTSSLTVQHLLTGLFTVGVRALWVFAGACALGAAVHYLGEWIAFRKESRMTREQVRREWREQVGSPEILAQRKRLRQEIFEGDVEQLLPHTALVVDNATDAALLIAYTPNLFPEPRLLRVVFGAARQQLFEQPRLLTLPVVVNDWLVDCLRAQDPSQKLPAQVEPLLAELFAQASKQTTPGAIGEKTARAQGKG